MKRALLILGVVALLAVPAAPVAAQWLGEPVWNSPKGGTGLTIYADYGKPNDSYGSGNAFGGRVSLGLGTLTLTAGLSTYKSDSLGPDRITSYGGNAEFRLIGGSLLPVAVNLQVGAAHSSAVTSGTQTLPAETTVLGAVGLSVPLPTPGFSIEPYLSPGIRYHHYSNVTPDHETNFGWVIGGNLGFGLVGIHLAYDSEKFDNGTTHGVFGVGANVGIKLPLGM